MAHLGKINVSALKNRNAPRCTFSEDVPWPGHGNAILKRRYCKNRTQHASGLCPHHRPVGLTEPPAGFGLPEND